MRVGEKGTAVGAETLETELLAVPGVASAEVEAGNGVTLAGVKVKLAPDADARRVGVEVQRVLATHGMRSRFATKAAPPPPAPAPSPNSSTSKPVQPPPPSTAPPADPPVPPMPLDPAPAVVSVSEPPSSVPPPAVPVLELRSVSVEERRDGLTATVVLADGRQAVRSVGVGGGELDAAVIAAIAEAAGEKVTTTAVEWLEVDGGSVVTVVINLADGSLAAGAGVVRIGRAFAVGLATQSALQA